MQLISKKNISAVIAAVLDLLESKIFLVIKRKRTPVTLTQILA